MPVLIPIIAAAASAAFATTVSAAIGLTALVGATVGSMIAGAVIGAAVGAVGAAITGGDIGKGALWGAVGGAVAGGFAGWASTSGSAAGEAAAASSTNLSQGTASPAIMDAAAGSTGSGGGGGAGLGLGSISEGSGTMGAAAITTSGQAISGYAQGQAQEEAAKEAAEAAEKARKEEFDQRIKEIMLSHEQRMGEIGSQTSGALALADKNNAAAMEQLNTRIGAEKDAVGAANAREDKKIAGFNESIRGTDENLFNRPTFDFAQEQQQDAFSSGFDEAVAAKTGQTVDAATLNPNDPLLLEKEKLAVA